MLAWAVRGMPVGNAAVGDVALKTHLVRVRVNVPLDRGGDMKVIGILTCPRAFRIGIR
jgi:hypothetical protein